jgi:hypothetical protein
MLPGSMLPPGLHIAAMDKRDSACENEEEYAQKFGRVVQLQRVKPRKHLVLLGGLLLVAIPVILMLLRAV